MLAKRNLAGEGSISAMIARGQPYGYRVEFSQLKDKKVTRFHISDYGTQEAALRAAQAYHQETFDGLPKIYGLPLRALDPNSLFPSNHLPHGVCYHLLFSNAQKAFYVRFTITVGGRSNRDNQGRVALNAGNLNNITEDDILQAQDHAIDIRRAYVACHRARIHYTPVIRGWQRRTPDSSVRKAGLNYLDVLNHAREVIAEQKGYPI